MKTETDNNTQRSSFSLLSASLIGKGIMSAPEVLPQSTMSDWEQKHQKHLSANRELARTQKWDYVIFPDNKWIKKWDKFILVQLIYLLFGIPYHVGITGGYHSYEGVTAKIFWLLVYLVIDLSFIVDTLLYFFRSFRNRHGQLRFDLKKIRRRYLRTYFILNVIALTPSFQTYYYVLGEHEPDDQSKKMKVLLSVLTVMKLARFARVRNLFQASDVMTDIRRTFRSFNVSLVFYLIFLLAVSHYIACIVSDLHHFLKLITIFLRYLSNLLIP